jgi:hypothetical protein
MRFPPSFHDLAPNDLWLFPKIKPALKGRRFQDIEDIKGKCGDGTESCSTVGIPRSLPRSGSQLHWAKCMNFQGEYFERDRS